MNNINEKEKQINKIRLMSFNEEENYNNLKKKTCPYTCILHCPLLSNDCVNSIDIFNNYLAFGTIMGDIYFCRIDKCNILNTNIPNINDINTNICNFPNEEYQNDLNKTDSNISSNKDIFLKDHKAKEIILNINNKKENKTKKEKGSPKCIKLNLNEKNGVEHQSTDNYSLNNNNKEIYDNDIFCPKIIKLVQNGIENICCISLFNDILNFSIGDIEILHCEKISSFQGNDISLAHNFKRVDIYQSEKSHCDFCESSSCLMSTNNFLILFSYYSDFSWPLKTNMVKYHNRNLKTNELAYGFIEMSNYNIPFDFDGDDFLYIEHIDKNIRYINIHKTLSNKIKFKYKIYKKFGHISHMKLLPDNCIFLCRNSFECEIYKYKINPKEIDNIIEDKNYKNKDENFILLNMWVHNQNKEIIASNVYILGNKISSEFKIQNYHKKNEIYKNSQIKKDNKKNQNFKEFRNLLHENEISSNVDSSRSKSKILGYEKEYNQNKYNNDLLNLEKNTKNQKIVEKDDIINVNKKYYKRDSLNANFNDSETIDFQNKEKYYIITLDIEGNFNLYYNTENNKGIKSTLFNLYKIDNIDTKYKKWHFFSIGYPYYIIMNEFFYVITTDSGAYVICSDK